MKHPVESDRLRQARAQAQERMSRLRGRLESISSADPRPGYLFVLANEIWIVVSQDPSNLGRFYLVPADDHPLSGSRDVAISEDTLCGPLLARCGYGLWIDQGALKSTRPEGMLEPEDLERVQRALWVGAQRGTDSTGEIDSAPEYIRLLEEGPARALRLLKHALEEPGVKERQLVTKIGSRRAKLHQRRRAAVLLAASLSGLFIGSRFLPWRTGQPGVPDPTPNTALVQIQIDTHQNMGPSRGRKQQILIPPRSRQLVLVVSLGPKGGSGAYALDLISDATGNIWAGDHLVPNDYGELTVSFPRDLLPNGAYSLHLRPLDDGIGPESTVAFELKTEGTR